MGATTAEKTYEFQAEVSQLMRLVTHSLYSNKEIFLRELISNASDAISKVKYLSIAKPELIKSDPDLAIWVNFDAEAKTITISDNGVGMTEEEVIKNLGSIAKSGTKDFLSKLTGDQSKDSQLIGQFGVGFYSAFVVADKVTVKTLSVNSNQAVNWESDGTGNFSVSSSDKTSRGSEITLYLKEDASEFLNDWTLRNIIKKYSDHISIPIKMYKEVKKDEKSEEVTFEEEVVNSASALWTRGKSEITNEQYAEFYKAISHDFDDPLKWSHNKVEGKLEYTMLLFLPKKAPFDLWHANKTRGLKLFVQRVFIMDEAEQFLPNYLRFIKGVIDSNDLPLNVSREILQNTAVTTSIKNAVVKKVLSMLETMSSKEPEKYQDFWSEFGQVLKEGPVEDHANQKDIAKLLRFASTNNGNEQQSVSLAEYVSRMTSEQDKIYYIAADSYNAASNSPHIELFKKKNIEVLLLTDKVDEWLMNHLNEYDGKKFQSIAKGKIDQIAMSETEKKSFEAKENALKSTLDKVKSALGDQVKSVRLSSRLTNFPACLVADEHDMTAQMERILEATGQKVPKSKPILELNADHPLVVRLDGLSDDSNVSELSKILFDQALLAEGGQLDDPAGFVSRFNDLLLNMSK